jgi:cytoskeletal protein CcmA (bactofilin family)
MANGTGLPGQMRPGAGTEAARSVIASDVRIEGSLATEGFLEFDGEVRGDLHAGALGVGRAARVKGNVSGGFVTVDGRVEGNVSGATVVIKPTGVVTGDIEYRALTVETGATLNGRVKRLPEPAAPAAAEPAAAARPADAPAAQKRPAAG